MNSGHQLSSAAVIVARFRELVNLLGSLPPATTESGKPVVKDIANESAEGLTTSTSTRYTPHILYEAHPRLFRPAVRLRVLRGNARGWEMAVPRGKVPA